MSTRTQEQTENQCPFHAERSGEVREVGSHAVWSLSSCKPGKKDVFFLRNVNKKLKLIFLTHLQVLVLNNYGIIQWKHTGNLMGNFHTSLTFSFLEKPQSAKFIFIVTTN